MGKNQSAPRTRAFAGVLYPESMPENWKEIIDDLHVKVLVSPLHDCDVNPDGEIKKSHYHILCIFDGPQPVDRWISILNSLGSNSTHVERVASTPGYARYLCHLDNPEKHQYSPDEVLSFGGADYASMIQRVSDDLKSLYGMMNIVRDNGEDSFSNFADWCAENHVEYFRLLACKFSVFMREYIKSSAYTRRTEKYS